MMLFAYSLLMISSFILVCFLGSKLHSLKRFFNIITLFWESKIVHNFRSMSTLGFPIKRVFKGYLATKMIDDLSQPLPDTFTNDQGILLNTREFLQDHWTTGLVVLKVQDTTNAKLVYEEYFRGNSKDCLVISWSTAKSMMGSLIGIAITENIIHNVHDPVIMYVPELKDSGYGQCTIKDILQMSSGVNFDENYFNPVSDINKLGYIMSFGVQ